MSNMNPKYLLHYSTDSGNLEYLVVSTSCNAETLAEHARDGATCTNVLQIEELFGQEKRGLLTGVGSNSDHIRLDWEHTRARR